MWETTHNNHIKIVCSSSVSPLQNASTVCRNCLNRLGPWLRGREQLPWRIPTQAYWQPTSVELWTAMTPGETSTGPFLFSACSRLHYWRCWWWPPSCGTCWCSWPSWGWGHSTGCPTTLWLPWPSPTWWWPPWSCRSASSTSWTAGCGNWAACCAKCGSPLTCSAAQPASGTWRPSRWIATGPSPGTCSTRSRLVKRSPMWWSHSRGCCPPSFPCRLSLAGGRPTQRGWSARWARSHPTRSSPPSEHFTCRFVWCCLFTGRSTRLPSFGLAHARPTQ